MIGAELGYRYVGSPLICDRAGRGAAARFHDLRAVDLAGRAAAARLARGHTALQDRIGYGDHYTLLRLGGHAGDAAGLTRRMRSHRRAVQVLDVDDAHAREVYGCDLMLLRPDMHIAWRGNAPPEDAAKLARMATGH